MSKSIQMVLTVLAGTFVLLMGFTTFLLGRQALAPLQSPISTQPVSLPAVGDEEKMPINTIQVTTEGTVRVEPDIAYITLGVQSQAKTAEGSQSANREKMAALYEVLKQMGIAEKDYYTTQYNVNPDYTYTNGASRIAGYTTTNMVEVTMRDLDKIGALLDAAAQVGMNQTYNLRFDLENPEIAGLDAMKIALANAGAKAQLMAQATGVQIARVLSVKDSVVNTAVPYNDSRYDYAKAADSAEAVPVSSGTIEVTVQANVTYEIQ